MRVGIHVGPVIAGLVGRRQFLFDIWGDTVNTAARIESHGIAGAINVSGDAWQDLYHFTVGIPLEDHRLQTLLPYGSMERR